MATFIIRTIIVGGTTLTISMLGFFGQRVVVLLSRLNDQAVTTNTTLEHIDEREAEHHKDNSRRLERIEDRLIARSEK